MELGFLFCAKNIMANVSWFWNLRQNFCECDAFMLNSILATKNNVLFPTNNRKWYIMMVYIYWLAKEIVLSCHVCVSRYLFVFICHSPFRYLGRHLILPSSHSRALPPLPIRPHQKLFHKKISTSSLHLASSSSCKKVLAPSPSRHQSPMIPW